MPRPKPSALAWAERPEDEEEDPCAISYAEGKDFVKAGFRVGEDGIFSSPAGQGKVSNLRLDQLRLMEVLGRGACSEVRRAEHLPTGISVALKVFDVADQNRRNQLIPELKALLGNRCPHLVSLYDAFYVGDKMYLALEFMDAGSLEHLLKVRPMPSEAVVAAIIKQAVAGLYYLHKEKRQVHRDLKPGNIIVNRQGLVKISDLGMAKEMNGGEGNTTASFAATFLGTVMYMSPERMKGEIYSYSSDIWSLGIIAYELAHYAHPYAGQGGNFVDLLQTILERPPPSPAANFTPHFHHFLSRCCAHNPKERAKIVELMEHPWVKFAPDANLISKWITE